MSSTGENSAVRSISERTRLGISLSVAVIIVGAIASGAWAVRGYTSSQEAINSALKFQMETMVKKLDKVEDQTSSLANRMTSLEYAVKDVSDSQRRRR